MLKRIVVLVAFLLPFAYVNAQVHLPAENVFAAGYNYSGVPTGTVTHTITLNDIEDMNAGNHNFPVVLQLDGIPSYDTWIIRVSKNGQGVYANHISQTSSFSSTICTLNLQVGDVVTLTLEMDALDVPPNASGLIYLGV
jgi:hypothetical protein